MTTDKGLELDPARTQSLQDDLQEQTNQLARKHARQGMEDWLEERKAIDAECAKARAWRDKAGFTRKELAALTGYSESAILAFERGYFAGNRPVEPRALLTYKLACAAVAAGVVFDWGAASFEVRGVRVTVD